MAANDSDYTRSGESIADYQWPSAYYGNAPEFSGDYWSGFYGQAFLFPPYFLDSQKRGESLPFYINERQLKVIRDRSRRLCAENEFAVSAIENRISYIVGSGFNYRVLPIHEDVDDKLIEQAQRVVDIFVEANRLGEREAETVKRVDKDGEAFIRMFFDDYGLMTLRFIEPEHVRSATGDTDAGPSFGIDTDPKDVETIRGYHVVESPTHDPIPKFVAAREIKHVRMNLDSGSKRGLPLLYPVEANLRRAEELLASMTSTAKARAKIALIRRIEGTSKTPAQALKSELENAEVYDPVTGGPVNVEQFKMGTILTASKNIDYEYPEVGNTQSGVEVLKAELRAIAARLVMPESMLTADASGGTYSSQLVAEAPATRNFERLQRFYRGVFGESRAPGHESLIWRQLAHAVRVGLLEQDTLTRLRIVARAPQIIPRDPDKSAAANKTYLDMGAKSPQGICDELGGNWDQVQRERHEAGLPDIAQMNGMMAGGMPGEQGQTMGGQAGMGEMPQEGQPGGEPGEEEQGSDEGMDGNAFEFDGSAFQ